MNEALRTEPGRTEALRPEAMVWHGGDAFRRTPMPVPELGPGEALAVVDLATVCGSDRHTVSGRRPGACPSILGHEAVGRLVAVHEHGAVDVQGRRLSVGDRVVWSVAASCGQCDRCRRGLTAKCRVLLKTGHEPLDGPWTLSGDFATHVHLLRGLSIARVPSSVPDGAAAVAACAGATVMACMEAGGPPEALRDRRVLVSGAGMLGLFACAILEELGAAEIEIRDVHPDRLATALDFGATRAVQVGGPDPAPSWDPGEQSEARFDLALELSGAPSSVRACLEALDLGGRLVLAGSVAPGPELSLSPERIVRSWLSIAGVHNYEPRHLQQAVDFLERTAGRFDWSAVIAEPLPLAQLPELLLSPEPVPTILRRAVRPVSRGPRIRS